MRKPLKTTNSTVIRVRSCMPRNYQPNSWRHDAYMTLRTHAGTSASPVAPSHEDQKTVIPIKDTSMSSLCTALPVLLTAYTHVLFVVTELVCKQQQRVRVGPIGRDFIFKCHVPVSSYVRHSLHNPPCST